MDAGDSPARPTALSARFTGSFAYRTVKDRLPVILTQVIDWLCRDRQQIQLKYGQESAEDLKNVIGKLSKLRSEMQTNKVILPLDDGEEDIALWNNYLSCGEPVRWFDSPWLLVECFMYRKVWQAFRESRCLQSVDPFERKKEEAFLATYDVMALLADSILPLLSLPQRSQDTLDHLIKLCLWANRNDLSLTSGSSDNFTSNMPDEHQILVNDTARVHLHVESLHGEENALSYVTDNTALELFADLCLADYLTGCGYFREVFFHIKKFPWFVSDATAGDFDLMLQCMSSDAQHSALSILASRWNGYLNGGRWKISGHHFWTSPVPYSEMATKDPGLYRQLSSSSLIIFKGDLNYRKLGSDLQWPVDTPFSFFLQGFKPAPLVAVRTLKAEIASGLEMEKAARVQSQDAEWMISGRYGVVQFCNDIADCK